MATAHQWQGAVEEPLPEKALESLSAASKNLSVDTGALLLSQLLKAREGRESEYGRAIIRTLLLGSGMNASDELQEDPEESVGGCGTQLMCATDILSYDTPITGLSDQSILDLAGEGKVSLFGSILRTLEGSGPGGQVSADMFIRSCSLAVRSGDVPARMNAKDMVLAALEFLSSTVPELTGTSGAKGRDEESHGSLGGGMLHQTFPYLPLIAHVGDVNDPEKRVYVKKSKGRCGSWSMSDKGFRRRVVRLEMAFMTSTAQTLGRLRSCPRLGTSAELALMRRGNMSSTFASKKEAARRSENSGHASIVKQKRAEKVGASVDLSDEERAIKITKYEH